MNSNSPSVPASSTRSYHQPSLKIRRELSAAAVPTTQSSVRPRPRQQPPVQELLPSLPFVARAVAEGLLKRDPESARKYVRQLVASNRMSL
ncbi:MAG: hypothetical protein AAFY11_04350 [Cyanobacteria bacterium J06641_5]